VQLLIISTLYDDFLYRSYLTNLHFKVIIEAPPTARGCGMLMMEKELFLRTMLLELTI